MVSSTLKLDVESMGSFIIDGGWVGVGREDERTNDGERKAIFIYNGSELSTITFRHVLQSPILRQFNN